MVYGAARLIQSILTFWYVAEICRVTFCRVLVNSIPCKLSSRLYMNLIKSRSWLIVCFGSVLVTIWSPILAA